MKEERRSALQPAEIVLVAGILFSIPFIFNYFSAPLFFKDYPMHAALIEYQAKNFWPATTGWNNQFIGGFPQGIFYPPLPHFIAAGLHVATGFDIEWIMKIFVVASFLALPLAILHFSRKICADENEQAIAIAAYFASVFFLNNDFIPWSIDGFFKLGTFAQAIAYPLLFIYLAEWAGICAGKEKPKKSPLREALLIVLLLTNAFSAIAIVIWYGAFVLLNLWRGKHDIVIYQIQHGLIGFALTAFFWIPFLSFLPYSYNYSFAPGAQNTADFDVAKLSLAMVLVCAPLWIWLMLSVVFGGKYGKGAEVAQIAVVAWLGFICLNWIVPVEEGRLLGYVMLTSIVLLKPAGAILHNILAAWGKDGKPILQTFTVFVVFVSLVTIIPWLSSAIFAQQMRIGPVSLPHEYYWGGKFMPNPPANNTFFVWEYEDMFANTSDALGAPVYMLYPAYASKHYGVRSASMLFIQSSPTHAVFDLISYSFSKSAYYGAVVTSNTPKMPQGRIDEAMWRMGAREISGSPSLLLKNYECAIDEEAKPMIANCQIPKATLDFSKARVVGDISEYKALAHLWLYGNYSGEAIFTPDGKECREGWRLTDTSYFPKWAAYSGNGTKLKTGMAFPYMLAVCGEWAELRYETQAAENIGATITLFGMLAIPLSFYFFRPTQKR